MRIRIYQLLSILGLAIIMGLLLIYYFKKQKERSLKQLRIIKEEKEAQYRRSEQYIAENNRQIKDLEIKLLEEKNRKDSISQELIQVQKELLRVNNEQVQLQLVERDLQRTNMERSNVYIKFHTVCNTKQYLVTDEDWAVLQQELDAAYNGLTHRLYTMYPNLSLIELRICYLIKISIKVSDMASLLLRSKSSISSARTRLYKKFTGEEGTPEKLDRYIIDLK